MEMLANSRSKLERRRGVPMLRSHPGAEDPRVHGGSGGMTDEMNEEGEEEIP